MRSSDSVKEREAGELEKKWVSMTKHFVGHASDVCRKRFVGGCMRRGEDEGGREKEAI